MVVEKALDDNRLDACAEIPLLIDEVYRLVQLPLVSQFNFEVVQARYRVRKKNELKERKRLAQIVLSTKFVFSESI